MGRIG